MKYAIISDIHGNVYALNAVLEDAEEYANEIGDSQSPYSVETWEQAFYSRKGPLWK